MKRSTTDDMHRACQATMHKGKHQWDMNKLPGINDFCTERLILNAYNCQLLSLTVNLD